MALESDELVVAASGHLWYAAVGSTFPTTPTSTPSSTYWKDAGYFSEAGAKLSIGRDTNDIKAWQSRYPLRTVVTDQSVVISGELLQWNRYTAALALGAPEANWTDPTTGVHKLELPDVDDLREVAVILDGIDGDKNYRWCFPRCQVVGTVETTYVKADPAMLPVELRALVPASGPVGYLLTDDTNADAAEAAS